MVESYPRLIALIGSSGSGKSALAHKLARAFDCEIFSLDSLSIYQEIDIASAKPTLQEQNEVCYYALNILKPNQPSNAMLFKNLLEQSIVTSCAKGKKVLLIVGGSSFFLKSIIEGLSPMPQILPEHKEKVQSVGDLDAKYRLLNTLDSVYAQKINPKDTYRIEKALEIYFSTNCVPSVYFTSHPKRPFTYPIEIFCIYLEKEALRKRIAQRTAKMMEQGIVEEAKKLWQHYESNAPALQCIGIKECIAFLESRIPSLKKLEETIFHHTCQLAKRQRTFNRTQFSHITHDEIEKIEKKLSLRINEMNNH